MDRNANYRLVGALVVTTVVAVVAAIMWLSDLAVQEERRYYTVYFKDHTLDGLQVDSWVTMRGIKVGTVDDFTIDPKNIEKVRVTLKLKADTPVKIDTQASIKRNLLTGLAWIDLIRSSADAALLETIAPGEEYPTIKEGVSQLDEIAANMPEFLDELSALTRSVQAVFSDENRTSLSRTLANIEVLTESLAKNRTNIETTIAKLQELAGEGAEVAKSLRQLTDTAREGSEELAADVKATVKRLSSVVHGIEQQIDQVMKSVRGVGEVLSQESVVVSQELRRIGRSLSETLQDYQNPRSLLGGPSDSTLGPGEARKR